MAITLSSLTEEMLTRQERAVVRSIYRVGQLAEALTSLEKSQDTLHLSQKGSLDPVYKRQHEHIEQLKGYLRLAMLNTLVNTKAPGIIVTVAPPQAATPE